MAWPRAPHAPAIRSMKSRFQNPKLPTVHVVLSMHECYHHRSMTGVLPASLVGTSGCGSKSARGAARSRARSGLRCHERYAYMSAKRKFTVGGIPDFVTHYHLADKRPLLNLSDLNEPELAAIMEDLEAVSEMAHYVRGSPATPRRARRRSVLMLPTLRSRLAERW